MNNKSQHRGRKSNHFTSKNNHPKPTTDEFFKVTLPYDFISLPGQAKRGKQPQYHYPYRAEEFRRPPRHDRSEEGLLSGYLEYVIHPHSPLVLELREGDKDAEWKTVHWLSGSQIRGKLRSNVEILSASYPEFVDDREMLYRKINRGDRYKEKLGVSPDCKLEQAVSVGYLYREQNGKYYIVPAQQIAGQNFVAVKEYDIVMWNNGVLKHKNRLYDWGFKDQGVSMLDRIKKLCDEIGKLDKLIYTLRHETGIKKGDAVDKGLQSLFLKEYAFTKVGGRIKRDLNQVSQNLLRSLKGLNALQARKDDSQVLKLLESLNKRWSLKAQLYLFYEGSYHRKFKNSAFVPYENQVGYILAGGIVDKIGLPSTLGEREVKGTLFNSTNASSKRAHYLIGEEQEEGSKINVPDATVAGYNAAFKRMNLKTTAIKKFYNLFNAPLDEDRETRTTDDDALNKGPKVVFYKMEGERVVLGRTPYFRVPYDHQLRKLLGEKTGTEIDYARAMFGFTPQSKGQDNEDEGEAYKSRLRFSPLRVYGEVQKRHSIELLLQGPRASAEAMYLKPNGEKPASYEKSESTNGRNPELRGTKYYHVLKEVVPGQQATSTDNE